MTIRIPGTKKALRPRRDVQGSAMNREGPTMIRAVVAALVLASCQAKVVELGRVDAGVDGPILPIDASSCRCRIMPCRVVGDCAVIGGACGPDFYCVGDFGPCTGDLSCQATVTGSVCTKDTASTTPCQ